MESKLSKLMWKFYIMKTPAIGRIDHRREKEIQLSKSLRSWKVFIILSNVIMQAVCKPLLGLQKHIILQAASHFVGWLVNRPSILPNGWSSFASSCQQVIHYLKWVGMLSGA